MAGLLRSHVEDHGGPARTVSRKVDTLDETGPVAQRIEQQPSNLSRVGSIPTRAAT